MIRRLILVGLMPLIASPCVVASELDTSDTGETTKDQPSVNEVIEQLGDDSYATRLRARHQLLHLGLEAFDELHAAQYHPDIEVEMAARYLVSSLMVSWSLETDPQEVRELLHDYGTQSEIERSSRIQRLSLLPPKKSVNALVRLTRFETTAKLSESAALALMNQTMDDDPLIRRQVSERITGGLGGSDRPPTQWLRVYATDLIKGVYSAAAWNELIQQQREQIDSAAAHPSTRNSVLELVRICASRAAELDKRDEAIRLATDHMDLIEPTSPKLIDATTWAIDHELHPFVLNLREQFQRMFDSKPLLLYAAAEATQIEGDQAAAQQLADMALNANPMPSKEDAGKMSASRRRELAQGHLDIAQRLQRRGQFDWSLREYEEILKSVELDSFESAIVRMAASRLLGELLRHQDVVELLQPLVERVDKDDKLRKSLQHYNVNLRLIRSELEYHSAQALLVEGKLEDARRKLSLAYLKNTANIDILIRMYHTAGNQVWRDEVNRLLVLAVRTAERNLQKARQKSEVGARGSDANLSEQLNNYAWLVSNTEGDYQRALEYSLESLELEIDGAKYDTCARCYFAVGDLENAIASQKKAIDLMPHSPPLERQLAEFQKKLEQQNK